MIIFIGISGSGKSLQGRMLADNMGYPWLSTGEFLRMLLQGPARQAMVSGQLVPDDQVIDLFQKMLGLISPDAECVVDGFPRTIPQTKWLLDQVSADKLKITAVFNLVVDEQVARTRLQARGRLDDHTTAIDERFSEYKQVTLPLIESLKQAGVAVHDIQADQTTQQIHQQITELARA